MKKLVILFALVITCIPLKSMNAPQYASHTKQKFNIFFTELFSLLSKQPDVITCIVVGKKIIAFGLTDGEKHSINLYTINPEKKKFSYWDAFSKEPFKVCSCKTKPTEIVLNESENKIAFSCENQKRVWIYNIKTQITEKLVTPGIPANFVWDGDETITMIF